MNASQQSFALASVWPDSPRISAKDKRWLAWVEACGLALLVPGAAWLGGAADPFFMQSGFPWLVLVPLLVGAQHGWAPALSSAVLLSGAAWLHGEVAGQPLGSDWPSWSMGCLVVGVLTGHFEGIWRKRCADVGLRSRELALKLEQLTRSHEVTKLSHARLEERLAAADWSLDTAVTQAHQRMQRCTNARQLYAVVLDVLAAQAHVQAATVVEVAGTVSGMPQLRGKASAVLGCAFGGAESSGGASSRGYSEHPIVQRALSAGTVSVLALDERADGVEEVVSVVAAVPLVTSQGRVLAVVAIEEMAFIAFEPENLAALGTIAQCLADQLALHLEPSEPVPRAAMHAELPSMVLP